VEDDRLVISSGMQLTPEVVASRSFGTRFRGYDQGEVRAFLKRVADELGATASREAELRRSLQEALNRAAHPQLDEQTLTSALGEHAARLLTNAREAATNIVSEAETRAARIIGEAEGKIARVRAEADSLLARRSEEAERLTAGLRQAAEADARALRERARAEAEAEVESARVQGREMVAEARALRERMLADLTRRRRTAEAQIEQLRLARQRLLEAYGVVRRTLDEATAELGAAEAEARPVLDAAAGSGPERSAGSVSERSAGSGTERSPGRPRPGDGGGATARPAPPPERPVHSSPDPTPPAPAPAPAAPSALPPREPLVRELAWAGGRVPAPPPGNGTLAAVPSVPGAEPVVAPEPGPEASPHPGADLRVGDAPPKAGPVAEPSDAAELAGVVVGRVGPVQPVEPVANIESVETVEPVQPVEKVDELFARLRAASAEPDLAGEPPPPVDHSPPAPLSDGGSGPAFASATNGSTTGRRSGTAAVDAPDEIADESARNRRDELLEPVEADLVRALKRALQDEQNEVLDNLRRQRRPSPAAVLPDSAAQRERYGAVAGPVLERAAHAGAEFAAGSEDFGLIAESAPDEVIADLVADLVVPLRQRVERVVEGAGAEGDDALAVADGVSAAYRQWKSEQVERIARHTAVAAFSTAALAATPDGARLRWVVDDDGPCPDCDDNALAGAVPRGEAFPTGQRHPPAHVGCRCLLVRTGP
jgi:DivIVA domain-containing protein